MIAVCVTQPLSSVRARTSVRDPHRSIPVLPAYAAVLTAAHRANPKRNYSSFSLLTLFRRFHFFVMPGHSSDAGTCESTLGGCAFEAVDRAGVLRHSRCLGPWRRIYGSKDTSSKDESLP